MLFNAYYDNSVHEEFSISSKDDFFLLHKSVAFEKKISDKLSKKSLNRFEEKLKRNI